VLLYSINPRPLADSGWTKLSHVGRSVLVDLGTRFVILMDKHMRATNTVDTYVYTVAGENDVNYPDAIALDSRRAMDSLFGIKNFIAANEKTLLADYRVSIDHPLEEIRTTATFIRQHLVDGTTVEASGEVGACQALVIDGDRNVLSANDLRPNRRILLPGNLEVRAHPTSLKRYKRNFRFDELEELFSAAEELDAAVVVTIVSRQFSKTAPRS
jgi:hypothetical protein